MFTECEKTYTVSFQFQDKTKTLVDKQIEKVISKIISYLEK